MRNKSLFFGARGHQIEPSPDFAQKTLAIIKQIRSRRKNFRDACMVCLIFIPFIIREIWTFIRHDYFSVSEMPFSNMIIHTYSFFLTGLAAYILLMLGIIGAGIYLYGNRLTSKFRFITQIFSQARFRI